VFEYLPHVTLLALLDTLVVLLVVPWVLMTKKDSTAALAWCLVVVVMPLMGALLFLIFGYNHVYRPVQQKRRHRAGFRHAHPPRLHEADQGAKDDANQPPTWNNIGALALKMNAFPISEGNSVTFFRETSEAFAQLLTAIRDAASHIHLEFFIIRADGTGEELLHVLTEKAKAGVEVRLLYDSMGGWRLRRRLFQPLIAAGGQVSAFLPLNPLRSRLQVNMRNHRKLAVIDGRLGFTGGMNIGDEYLGKNPRFGYWRDEFLRLEGPAVAGLQRIFAEDWDWACDEALNGKSYFPELESAGPFTVQIVESGPDQQRNGIREIYHAAINSARKHLWIASPYFVPDAGLLDAIYLARYRGVDVRLLTLARPDHYLSFYAGRYYWTDVLAAGVQVYEYQRGMMHSKLIMADGEWGMVGSANLDNRSLHLNFEVGCLLLSPALVAEVELAFLQDLTDSTLVEAEGFARRSFASRLAENACRLLSPIL
jgi:cardiolipin synthase